MKTDPATIKRNKRILIIFSIILNVAWLWYLLSRSSFYGFSGVFSRLASLGVKGFLKGTLGFFLLWWVFGALVSSINGTFVMFLFGALHWRDLSRSKHDVEPDLEVGFGFSIVTTFVLFGILLLIHMLGIVEINWLLQ